MSAFTCLSCHVAFQSFEGQREHFQSDWHRYNLMRKVSELPPVSREVFNERVGQMKTIQENTLKAPEKIPCRICKKTFTTDQAYDNHLQSKKHMEMCLSEESRNHINKKKAAAAAKAAAKAKSEDNDEEDEDEDGDEDEDMEVEEVDDDEWYMGEAIPLLDCLFCNHRSKNVETELLHLTDKHSFFIPDLEYCVDVPGLLTYLGQKIGCGFECPGCQWTARKTPNLTSVRKHINDKHHRRILLEGDGLVEYADFYDYSSSYPDAGQGPTPDDVVDQNVLYGNSYELVLPSGAVIGHRSLRRYYKQKLDPKSMAVVQRKSTGASMRSVMNSYRMLGWQGSTKVEVERKRRDIKYWHHVRSKFQMQVSVKASKLFIPRASGIML
ncbi:hypothetical protein Pmani_032830 [Petrolisthes manimaculis]|uniref:C2H2-type domain-containing protein n=1 Tax=Petrolisthes manimaculis TaxID=1843537 RepID=A0AAE1NQX4_9EUCA|nr:hypothetical protein Pmani_032830 [Petrolisthes manimaculis]